MMRTNKIIEKDIDASESHMIIPSRELILGKAYKQRGKLTVEDDVRRYFLERIRGTDDRTTIFLGDALDPVEVKCAMFEVYIRLDDGAWQLIEQGMLPTEIKVYEQMSSYFF